MFLVRGWGRRPYREVTRHSRHEAALEGLTWHCPAPPATRPPLPQPSPNVNKSAGESKTTTEERYCEQPEPRTRWPKFRRNQSHAEANFAFSCQATTKPFWKSTRLLWSTADFTPFRFTSSSIMTFLALATASVSSQCQAKAPYFVGERNASGMAPQARGNEANLRRHEATLRRQATTRRHPDVARQDGYGKDAHNLRGLYVWCCCSPKATPSYCIPRRTVGLGPTCCIVQMCWRTCLCYVRRLC